MRDLDECICLPEHLDLGAYDAGCPIHDTPHTPARHLPLTTSEHDEAALHYANVRDADAELAADLRNAGEFDG